jgi:hypothetical protein
MSHTNLDRNSYTKDQINQQLILKRNVADSYSKVQIDSLLNNIPTLTNVYLKPEVDLLLDEKADEAITYTKAQVDNGLELKRESDSYGKAYIDTGFANVYVKNVTYNKPQVNDLLVSKRCVNVIFKS